MAERHTPTAEVEMSVSSDGAAEAPRDSLAEQTGQELPS
jgi:hypothetical protein